MSSDPLTSTLVELDDKLNRLIRMFGAYDSVFSSVYKCCLCKKKTVVNVLLESHERRKYTHIILDGLEEWPAVQVCNQCAALYSTVPFSFERRIKWLRFSRWYTTSFWAQFATCLATGAIITLATVAFLTYR